MNTRQRRRPADTLNKGKSVKYYSSPNSTKDSGKTPQILLPIKRRSGLIGRLFDFSLMLIFLVLVGLLLAVRSPAKVTADNEVYSSIDAYSKAANGYISSLANKNKVTFNEAELEAKMKAQFPEIANLKVDLPILSATPKINLSIYGPTILLRSGSASFVIDKQGRAVGDSSDFDNIDKLIKVTDESGFEIREGQPVLSRSSTEFIESLSAHLSKSKIPIDSLILPARPQELLLRTQDQDYFVKFHLGGSPEVQIGQYLAARAHFDDQNITPSEYLDVRVSGRVFYK